MLQVAAYLVQSAGARVGLDQAVAAEHLPAQELGLGADPRGVAIFTGRQWMIDESSAGWNATHQGQIGFLDRVCGERLAQAGRDLGRKGEEQDAAGGAVQTVHRKHVHAQLVSYAHHGHIAFARPSPMHGKARGFVHRDQRLVTEENGQIAWHAAQPTIQSSPTAQVNRGCATMDAREGKSVAGWPLSK